jgi:hypothetical protein
MSIFKTVLKGILLCAALSLTGCNNGNGKPSTTHAEGGENPIVSGGGNDGEDSDKPLVEIDNTKCGNDPVDLPNTSGDVTGLVFGDGHGLSNRNQAWVKDNGDNSCEGYVIYNQLPFGSSNNWAEVKYDKSRSCWYASEIASCGWRVDGDTLRIGYSAMAEHGVVWGWDFEGTYKVSGNELTLTAPGKAPVVYTKRELSPMCYEVEGN